MKKLFRTPEVATEHLEVSVATLETARATARRRAQQRRRTAKYRATPKGKAAISAYTQRPRVKESSRNRRNARRATIPYRVQAMLDKARARARQLGIKCTLTRQSLLDKLAAGVCSVSGWPLHFGQSSRHHRHPLAPSLDRILSTGHYTDANTRVVCVALNVALAEWGDTVYLLIHSAALKNLRTGRTPNLREIDRLNAMIEVPVDRAARLRR